MRAIMIAAVVLVSACGSGEECAGPRDLDCNGGLDIAEAPVCEDCEVRCNPPESEQVAACWQGEAPAPEGVGRSCSTSISIEDHRDTWIRCEERDGVRVPVCYRMRTEPQPDDVETPFCVDTRT